MLITCKNLTCSMWCPSKLPPPQKKKGARLEPIQPHISRFGPVAQLKSHVRVFHLNNQIFSKRNQVILRFKESVRQNYPPVNENAVENGPVIDA